jgi:hypothetical protein
VPRPSRILRRAGTTNTGATGWGIRGQNERWLCFFVTRLRPR